MPVCCPQWGRSSCPGSRRNWGTFGQVMGGVQAGEGLPPTWRARHRVIGSGHGNRLDSQWLLTTADVRRWTGGGLGERRRCSSSPGVIGAKIRNSNASWGQGQGRRVRPREGDANVAVKHLVCYITHMCLLETCTELAVGSLANKRGSHDSAPAICEQQECSRLVQVLIFQGKLEI